MEYYSIQVTLILWLPGILPSQASQLQTRSMRKDPVFCGLSFMATLNVEEK